jgi:hypothetical protein
MKSTCTNWTSYILKLDRIVWDYPIDQGLELIQIDWVILIG